MAWSMQSSAPPQVATVDGLDGVKLNFWLAWSMHLSDLVDLTWPASAPDKFPFV
jgi:hypothetical protein